MQPKIRALGRVIVVFDQKSLEGSGLGREGHARSTDVVAVYIQSN